MHICTSRLADFASSGRFLPFTFYRVANLACFAAALLLNSASASAQAYLYATGTFSASSGQFEDFNFSVSGPVATTLKTYAYSGGTSVSGYPVNPGGIDSILALFNGANSQIAQNDDANNMPAVTHDSLLSPSGLSSSLLPPLASGSYRLRMTNFGSAIGDGHWATDISTASGTLTITGIGGSTLSTVNELHLGSAGGTASLSLSGSTTVNVKSLVSLEEAAFIDISSGTLACGQLNIGVPRLGIFSPKVGAVTQTGGTVNVGSFGMYMAYGAADTFAQYTLNAGTLISGSSAIGMDGTAIFYQNGGTHNAGQALAVGYLDTSVGQYFLNAGTLSGAYQYVGVIGNGELKQTGGTNTATTALSVALFSGGSGRYLLDGGTLTAPAAYLGGGLVEGGAPRSGGAGTLVIASGATANIGTLHLFDQGSLYLTGGTLNVGTIDNNDSGVISFTAGSINFSSNLPLGGGFSPLDIGANRTVNVAGTTTLPVGAAINLSGGTFASAAIVSTGGTVNFTSGTLKLTNSSFTVGPAGLLGNSVTLDGSKTLITSQSATVNAGALLLLKGGTLSAGSVSNSGEIQLRDPASLLAGLNGITNSALIDGDGRISGQLINNPIGELRASAGQRLTISGFVPGQTNAGVINTLGGTIEYLDPLTNNGSISLIDGTLKSGTLTNNARITGRGAIIASGISNNGSISLSGGFSDVHGALSNASGAKTIVTGGSTSTFYDNVANSAGSEFRVSTNSTAVFLGDVTGLGQFTGPGIKDFEASASLGPLLTSGGSIVGRDASLVAQYVRETSLQIEGSAQIQANGTTASTSRLQSLTIDGSPGAWTGRLDLSDNDLVIDYAGASPIVTTINQIRTAHGTAATWSGNGITSSLADASTHALGVADNASMGLASFSGQTIDSTTILIKYTWYGDANLDGQVDVTDLGALATNWQTSASWTGGDFNYDGFVNVTDLGLLATNWQAGVGNPLVLSDLASALSALGIGGMSVPEPALAPIPLLLCLGAAWPPRKR